MQKEEEIAVKFKPENVFTGKKIRAYRVKKKWLQEDLAKRINMKGNTVSAYERGAVAIPHAKLVEIAKALEVSTIDLLPIEGTQDTISEYMQEVKSELNEEQLELFNELFKKTLSLKGNERANFLENIRFAIQFINKK